MKLKAPERVTWTQSGFCPGCGHGIAFRLIAEVMEELGLSDKLLLTVDVACCSLAIECVKYDTIMCAHGRGVATAIGAKKVRPENPVCAYLGDGAAYSIGMAETIHTGLRNDNVVVITVNNSLYGMTGGQMAPTTLPGQKTTSSKYLSISLTRIRDSRSDTLLVALFAMLPISTKPRAISRRLSRST